MPRCVSVGGWYCVCVCRDWAPAAGGPEPTHLPTPRTNRLYPTPQPPKPAPSLTHPQARRSRQPYPRLLILVTGRGPQRAAYEAKMAGMDLAHVAFRTVWLEPGDYPTLLGSADLGVCLHTSSSGLDLPMKVCAPQPPHPTPPQPSHMAFLPHPPSQHHPRWSI